MSMERDQELYNEYMREYVLKRYHRRREEAINLLGGKCAKCGSAEELDFDHIDPATKFKTMASLLAGYSEEVVRRELAKCQLLCKSCHLKKTKQEGSLSKGWQKQPRLVHGTIHTYRRHECRCDKCRLVGNPSGIRHRAPVEHGTRRGYLLEIRRGIPTCEECRKANADYTKSLRTEREE